MSARRCSATSKRTGQPCRANAIIGRATCYHHGGMSRRGGAAPNFMHGRYSKQFPAEIMAAYLAARDDPDLLSMREEIFGVDALIRGAEAALLTDASPTARDRLVGLYLTRTKLVEAEQRHQVALGTMMTMEQALVLLKTWEELVRRYIRDPADLRSFERDLELIIVGRPEKIVH
jgi:hypothetical protein